MQRTGAEEQIAAQRIQFPAAVQLAEQVAGETRDALGLFGVDHKTTLNITQSAAADVLFNGEMQHAIHQPFP